MNAFSFSLVHKPSGRTLDVYTDMPCIHVNTAQGFPDYGILEKIKENSTNASDSVLPNAIFGESGSEYHSRGAEETTMNSLEQLISENVEEGITLKIPESNLYPKNKAKKYSPIIGKSKAIYNKLCGISLRPQHFPDAPNHVSCNFYRNICKWFFINSFFYLIYLFQRNFGNINVQPSTFYSQRVIYKFGVIQNQWIT